jgi:multimeric flavodoxin WrbA
MKSSKKQLSIIIGSPRKGNSYHIGKLFKEEAEKNNWNTEIIFLHAFNILSCKGCYQFCTTKIGIECVIQDDMQEIIAKLLKTDLTIFSVPLYNSSYPAIMSSFLERCLPLWEGYQTEETLICNRVLTKNKKAVLSIVQEENTQDAADLAFKIFEHTIGHIYGYNILDKINIRGVKMPKDLEKDVEKTKDLKKRIKEIFNSSF